MKRMTENLKKVLADAEQVAKDYQTSYIGTEHIVFAMLATDCSAGKMLKHVGVDAKKYNRLFERTIDKKLCFTELKLTPLAKAVLQNIQNDIVHRKSEDNEDVVGTKDVLFAILTFGGLSVQILCAMGIDLMKLKQLL